MSAYSHLQEFNDLLWATPAPIITMINAEMVKLRVKGVCSVSVTDVRKIQEKIPDPSTLLTQVRSVLAGAVTDSIIASSRGILNISEFASKHDTIVDDLKLKAAPALGALGLEIKRLEIQAVEEV